LKLQEGRARGFSSSEVRMPEAEVTGGVVEIPLAQTGEGIADCELIRWFVKEVNVVSREDFVYDARSEPP
jgi:2-oxoisovalerate dehydrogenase E2 component (dihydrolipoyl transacylase)